MILIISSQEKLVGGRSNMASRFGVIPSDLASFKRVSSTEGSSLRESARLATSDLYSSADRIRFPMLMGRGERGWGDGGSIAPLSWSARSASAQCRTETVIVDQRSGYGGDRACS